MHLLIRNIRGLLLVALSCTGLMPWANAAILPSFNNAAVQPAASTTAISHALTTTEFGASVTAANIKNYLILNFDPYKIGSTVLPAGNIKVEVDYSVATTPAVTGTLVVTYNKDMAAANTYQSNVQQLVRGVTVNALPNATVSATQTGITYTLTAVMV